VAPRDCGKPMGITGVSAFDGAWATAEPSPGFSRGPGGRDGDRSTVHRKPARQHRAGAGTAAEPGEANFKASRDRDLAVSPSWGGAGGVARPGGEDDLAELKGRGIPGGRPRAKRTSAPADHGMSSNGGRPACPSDLRALRACGGQFTNTIMNTDKDKGIRGSAHQHSSKAYRGLGNEWDLQKKGVRPLLSRPQGKKGPDPFFEVGSVIVPMRAVVARRGKAAPGCARLARAPHARRPLVLLM